jgi:hypothetical protein
LPRLSIGDFPIISLLGTWRSSAMRVRFLPHPRVRGQPTDCPLMRKKLSNEQRHERIFCAFTHRRIAWFFIVVCALEVFLSWRTLDKPISRPSLLGLPFYILVFVVYTPIFMGIFRCSSERFVIGIGIVPVAIAAISWFAPTLFNPVAFLVGRVFLVLWVLAFLLSLNMAVQSVRNPNVEPDNGDREMKKRELLILSAVIVVSLLLGTLLYFVPLR